MPEGPPKETCPKCARPRPREAVECPYCGILYGRFHAISVPRPAVAPAAPAQVTFKPAYVSPSKVEALLEQMAQTLATGMTLRAFVGTEAVRPLPGPVAEKLRADVYAGLSLSQSLDALGVLDAGSLALIRAKEVHGGLPEGLRAVADRLSHRRKLRRNLLLGLAYPACLILAAAVVVPLPVAFRCGPGAYLARLAPILLGATAIGIFAFVIVPRLGPTSSLRRALGGFGRMIPLGRAAAYDSALSAFAGVLGAGLKAGLPAREALVLAAEAAAPHPAFAEAPARLLEQLDRGATLADALRVIRSIPLSFVGQVSVGELAGTLDTVLPALEDQYQKKARFSLGLLVAIVGGTVFLGALAFIAYQVVTGFAEVLKTQAQQIDQLSR